ncbi:MFS transporter [Corynebacterium sp. sy017]|uniref:MFS transporter n=1 Tax=unclassified Corynebacterium TaxID=2624378 RepID=UPI0011862A4D|nr:MULTISPECIES: MFS transporter [unclassified Corynebacterium]MBP3089099.1 MFS transporter [Corynebacterium sp. sy017]TSD91413.1 MFS transporter [Corynebacterium sp. SY003]
METDKDSFSKVGKLILTLCSLGQFLVVLDASIVNIALPSFRQEFDMSGDSLQWLINIYTILFAALLLVGGVLSDAFGSRKVLLAGSLIFGTVSLLAGFSQNETTLIIFRALQGASAGLIAPSTLSIIASTFAGNGSLRGKAFGIWGATASAGGAAGVIFGGVITQWLSWHWVFWVNVPLVVVLLFLIWKVPMGGNERSGNILLALRSVGVVVIAAFALVVLIYSALLLSSGDTKVAYGLIGFVIAVVLIAMFWVIQTRLKNPVIPPALFKSSSVVLGNVTALVSSGSIFATYYFLTLQMQESLGFSPIEIGLSYLPMTVLMFFSARLAGGFLSAKMGGYVTNCLGLLVAGIGLLLLALASLFHSSNLLIVIMATLLLGIGQGIITTSSSMLATTGIDWKFYGIASGLVNTSRQVGGALLLGSIVAVVSGAHGDKMFESYSAYSLAFFLAAVSPILLSVAAFIMKARFSSSKANQAN